MLVVGHEGYNGAVDDSVNAELWDPATDAWQLTMSLNKPRADFAALPLADGRALLTGGYNQENQSFSSTYLFDPQRVAGGSAKGWTATGLLDKARTGPAAAVLSDGRVLVAGGYFRVAPHYPEGRRPADGILAGYRSGAPSRTSSLRGPLFDLEPMNVGAAMATAELFDPATGKWSETGPLKYARYGAQAVTLTDGRVLVVGSGPALHAVTLDAGAYDTAEVFDPATGRFSLTGGLPEIDLSMLEAQGEVPDLGDAVIDDVGTLLALDDGGAVVIGHVATWKHVGNITRSFRYNAGTGSWTEIGQTFAAAGGEAMPEPLATKGVRSLAGAMAARLADGRIVVAGGAGYFTAAQHGYYEGTTTESELYDPATNVWSPLPPMPEPRADGAVVALADGSALFIGGWSNPPDLEGSETTILASAVRFVPSP